MKRLLLYALIIGVVWAVPTEKTDVAKLRPVEVIAIYKSGDEVLMMTDTEDVGTGRTAEEALELGYEQLSQELSALSGEVQLLQKEIVTEMREDSVVLICTLTCIENIALVQEFEITQ